MGQAYSESWDIVIYGSKELLSKVKEVSQNISSNYKQGEFCYDQKDNYTEFSNEISEAVDAALKSKSDKNSIRISYWGDDLGHGVCEDFLTRIFENIEGLEVALKIMITDEEYHDGISIITLYCGAGDKFVCPMVSCGSENLGDIPDLDWIPADFKHDFTNYPRHFDEEDEKEIDNKSFDATAYDDRICIVESEHSKMGYIMNFGLYPEKRNGKPVPLTWKILDIKDGKALIITDYVIDCRSYNDTLDDITWSKCTLRNWLNTDFYNSAFNDDEKRRICLTEVSAEKNPKFNTACGKSTKDYVFLLSISECEKYSDTLCYYESATDDFGFMACLPTKLANSNCEGNYIKYNDVADINGKPTCNWWLRNPGEKKNKASLLDCESDIFYYGYSVKRADGVRPAVWISL